MQPTCTTLMPKLSSVLDDFNTAVGNGGDGSISGYGITGCVIATANTVDNHGRAEKV